MAYDVKLLYNNAGHKMADAAPLDMWTVLGEALGTKIYDSKEQNILDKVLSEMPYEGQPKMPWEEIPVAGEQEQKQEQKRVPTYSELMAWSANEMMKGGLNSRADKYRQEADKAKAAELAEKQQRQSHDLAERKFEFEKEQMGHWSKNPEVQGLQSMASKYIQDYHAAYVNKTSFDARGIPETDVQYRAAVANMEYAQNELQKINQAYDRLGVPESMRWYGNKADTSGNESASTKPASTQQEGTSTVPYYLDKDQKMKIVKDLIKHNNKQHVSPEYIGAWLSQNGYDVSDDLAEKKIAEAYNNEIDAIHKNKGVKQSDKDYGDRKRQEQLDYAQKKFDSEFKNYSSWVNQVAQSNASSRSAISYFQSGNYKAVVDVLHGSFENEDKIGLSLPIFKVKLGSNPGEKEAIDTMKAFNESIKVIEKEVERANARRKEIFNEK